MNRLPSSVPWSRFVILAFLLIPATGRAQVIRGTVVDEATGRTVVAAQVTVGASNPDTIFRTTSSSDGSFQVRLLKPGEYRLRVEALGYAPLLTDPVKVIPNGVVTIELRLRLDAIALKPLRVVAERVEPMFMADIRRRQAMGFGQLVTREELEQRPGSDLRSVLAEVPGVNMVTVGRGGDMIPLVQTRAAIQTGRSCFAALYVNGARQYPPRDTMSPLGKQIMIDRVHDFFVISPAEIEAIEVYRGLTEVGEFGDEFGVCGVVAVWLRTGHERRAEEPAYGTMRLAPSHLRVSAAGSTFSGVHAPENGVALESALQWRITRFLFVGIHGGYSGQRLSIDALRALTQGLDAQQYVLPTGSRPMTLLSYGVEARVSPGTEWRIRPVLSGRAQLARRSFDIGDAVTTTRTFDQSSSGRGVGFSLGAEIGLWKRLSLDVAVSRDWLNFDKYPNLERPWRPTAAKWHVTFFRLGLGYAFLR